MAKKQDLLVSLSKDIEYIRKSIDEIKIELKGKANQCDLDDLKKDYQEFKNKSLWSMVGLGVSFFMLLLQIILKR
ncbi:MAG: hypothetical protein QXN68_00535 [Thermoplasmata archaeon]